MDSTAIPLIMTRPEGANEGFLKLIPSATRAALDIILSPLIEIVGIGETPTIPPDSGAIFTSGNGVRFGPQGFGRPAFCVGQSTTARAVGAGWQAVCAGTDSGELVEALMKTRPERPLVHLGGVHARGNVAERLSADGLLVSRIEVYDQKLLPLTEKAKAVLQSNRPVIVPLFSPRTARQFSDECPAPSRVAVAALSPSIARSLGTLPVAWLEIAETPDAEAICASVEKLIRAISLG
jgi:uroporphyrinogen-III synthase